MIQGSLFVPEFNATGTPGEYQIIGATYNSQSDLSGGGAFNLALGFALVVPAADVNSFAPIPGVVHRYTVTAVTPVSQSIVDLTILWNELGVEVDAPLSGSYCLISETSPTRDLMLLAADDLYPEVAPGTSLGGMVLDAKNIVDTFTTGGGGPVDVTRRVAFVGNLVYRGNALPGSLETNPVWQIWRADKTENYARRWADGNANFDNAWVDYLTLAYS